MIKSLASLPRYANWHIRRYRRKAPIVQQGAIFATHCLLACFDFSFGVLATPVNVWLVAYGISLLALTIYIHRPLTYSK